MKTKFLILLCIVFFSCAKKEQKEVPVKDAPIEVTVVPVQAKEEIEDKLIFTVQIAALKKSDEVFTNLENIKIFQENGLVKYRLGAFETYKEARNHRTKLIRNYKGAFVQALLNDTPISITKAIQY